METKLISVTDAVPGMIVASDIFSFNNILLIEGGSCLTDRIITRLMFYNIDEIEIIISMDKPEPTHEFDNDMLENITEEEKRTIKEFTESTAQCVTSLKTALNDAFINDKPIDYDNLVNDVNSVLSNSRNALHLITLLTIMKKKNDVIFHHSINVAMLANMVGKMINLNDEDLNTLTLGAVLHDVGKLTIPQRILEKDDELTPADFAVIKTHPIKGYELLTNQDVPLAIKNIALMHHERCDGSGYPHKLKSKDIDRLAKIVAIVDCYEAMTSPRAYRDLINPFEVLEFFENEGLRLFEPEYLLPFINGLADSYINRRVLLSNQEKGTIILINKLALSKPMVKLDSGKFVDLYSDRSLSITRILI